MTKVLKDYKGVSIVIIVQLFYYQDMIMSDDEEEKYKTSVIAAWIMLRCVSFCLVTCDEDPAGAKSSMISFRDILAYCFYFPHFITGPYVPYKDYVKGVSIFVWGLLV